MDESRYARYGGFRRQEGQPYLTQFGYGGSGYGGFGRKGKYGGYRSHYNYKQPMNYNYGQPMGPPANMVYPTSHTPTFLFAAAIIIILLLGLWFGKKTGYAASTRYTF